MVTGSMRTGRAGCEPYVYLVSPLRIENLFLSAQNEKATLVFLHQHGLQEDVYDTLQSSNLKFLWPA